MSALLTVFSCCLQRKPAAAAVVSPFDQPNEHTHLIPASADLTPSSPSAYVVDQQQVNERMYNVVRSKESKMVNVTARLPFNLRNPSFNNTLDPSTSPSRSASTSTLGGSRPSLGFTHSYSYTNTTQQQQQTLHGNVQGHVGAPLMTAYSVGGGGAGTGGALSRSSSLTSRETSAHGSELERERWAGDRKPILNARLVRGVKLGGNASASARRGRRTRRGFGLGGGGMGGEGDSSRKEEENAHSGSISRECEGKEEVENQATPREHHTLHGAGAIVIPAANASVHPTLYVSPASTVGFQLQDAGPLTVSWGD